MPDPACQHPTCSQSRAPASQVNGVGGKWGSDGQEHFYCLSLVFFILASNVPDTQYILQNLSLKAVRAPRCTRKAGSQGWWQPSSASQTHIHLVQVPSIDLDDLAGRLGHKQAQWIFSIPHARRRHCCGQEQFCFPCGKQREGPSFPRSSTLL